MTEKEQKLFAEIIILLTRQILRLSLRLFLSLSTKAVKVIAVLQHLSGVTTAIILSGKNFYSNHNLVILDCAEVIFGDNVFVGPNCGFYTACHPVNAEQRNLGIEFAKPIKVGNDVWFGGGVTVVPGVTIGDNVVIGAGSVVVKDIPSGVVAAGNPCRVIRPITDDDKLNLD